MHLRYPQAHLASVKRGRPTTVSVRKLRGRSLCTHNHTNVANSKQLRLSTFPQPTFFLCCPPLPRQRSGKRQLTHLFSQSHTQTNNCGAGAYMGYTVYTHMLQHAVELRLEMSLCKHSFRLAFYVTPGCMRNVPLSKQSVDYTEQNQSSPIM